MQFREFGEWINRLSNGHERYLVFGHMTTVNEIVLLAVEAGVSDRIRAFRTTGVAKDFIYVVVETEAGDAVRESAPLVDALRAAIRTDLKTQLFEQEAKAFEQGRPSTFTFENIEHAPEDEAAATHPDGEHLPKVSDLLDKLRVGWSDTSLEEVLEVVNVQWKRLFE